MRCRASLNWALGGVLIAHFSACGGQTSHETVGSGRTISSSGGNGGASQAGAGVDAATAGVDAATANVYDGGGSGGTAGEAGGTDAPPREPGPCTGDCLVSSRAEYEALVAERCTEITGNPIITQDGDLSSTPGLQTLMRVDGTVTIDRNPALTSLRTFANLQSVGGDFHPARRQGAVVSRRSRAVERGRWQPSHFRSPHCRRLRGSTASPACRSI